MLGTPSNVLLSGGVENKPMKLYGNKVIKKMRKHGFALAELNDLQKPLQTLLPYSIIINEREIVLYLRN